MLLLKHRRSRVLIMKGEEPAQTPVHALWAESSEKSQLNCHMNASLLALVETTCSSGRRYWNHVFNCQCLEMKYSLYSILRVPFRSHLSYCAACAYACFILRGFLLRGFLTAGLSDTFLFDVWLNKLLTWDDLQFSLNCKNKFFIFNLQQTEFTNSQIKWVTTSKGMLW